MARPGLTDHPKFRRLCHILGEPVPHIWGYLECLWLVGYQSGNDLVGDETDVELAARFTPLNGKFCAAALESRFLDRDEDGRYRIHDLYDNAPEYVRRRGETKTEWQKKRECPVCNVIYRSAAKHSTYCSDKCRLDAHREREKAKGETKDETHETEPIVSETEQRVKKRTIELNLTELKEEREILTHNGEMNGKPKPTRKPRLPREAFTPPTLEQVRARCDEMGYMWDPEKFWNHFQSNGWRVGGKAPMKDWHAAMGKWNANEKEGLFNNGKPQTLGQATLSIDDEERKTREARERARKL